MNGELLQRLSDHMDKEESFQLVVSESLKETAVALATVAARLEGNERLHQQAVDSLGKLDNKLDEHEKRINSVEHSVGQAATVAKWFFGGGFVAACASVYFLYELLQSLGEILKYSHAK